MEQWNHGNLKKNEPKGEVINIPTNEAKQPAPVRKMYVRKLDVEKYGPTMRAKYGCRMMLIDCADKTCGGNISDPKIQ